MTRRLGLIVAAAIIAVPAFAAVDNDRVRGTIEAVDPNGLTVRTDAGESVKIALNDATKYASVVKSSLSNVEKGSFIGTATKGTGSFLVALEVVIFPPSMRGTGEGHYAWDKLRDTTMAGGMQVNSSMTNGTVQAAAPAGGPAEVNSTMTNGNVAAASDAGGAKRLTVTYKGGQQTIIVPPTAPIVAFQPADRSIAAVGGHVFVKTSEAEGKMTADFVAVGKDGLEPPM
ncbi:MAG: hypothetical protein ACM3N5_11535 [Candidatus Eiseniibacteriota bacterium]